VSLPAHRSAAPANGSVFAINDAGQLALKKGEAALILDPAEFARLRVFIERAESIFNPSE
jgi:hypothetical protein